MRQPHAPEGRERYVIAAVAGGWAATISGATMSPALWGISLAAMPLIWIDLFEHRLPHQLVLPMIPALLLVTSPIAPSLLAGGVVIILFGIGVVLAGMGAGDATTAGLLAVAIAPLGVELLTAAFALAFVAAGSVAVVGLLMRRTSRTDAMAFGPALFLGAGVVAVLSG